MKQLSINIKILIALMLIIGSASLIDTPQALAQQNHPPAQFKEETPQEFVDRNLAAARKRLAAARNRYQQSHGLADLALDPIDPSTILQSLPKPRKLKFSFRQPENISEIKPAPVVPGDWTFYPGYLNFSNAGIQSGYSATAATDEITSALLRVPRNLPLYVTASIIGVNSQSYPVEKCCLEYKILKNNDGSFAGSQCVRTAQEKYMSVQTNIDPRAWSDRIGFHLTTSEGKILGNGASARFDQPGPASITATFTGQYKEDEFTPQNKQYCQAFDYTTELIDNSKPARYRLNVQNYNVADRWHNPGFKTIITGDWKIPQNKGEQKQKIDVEVIAVKGLHLDGKDYTKPRSEAGGYDLFARENEDFKAVRFEGKSAPSLILQRAAPLEAAKIDGSRPGAIEVREPITNWKTALNYSVEGGGPFVVSQQGDVRPLGSIGEALLKIQLGQHWSLSRKLTANRWQAVLDQALADGAVSPGASYSVALQVQGPADMTKYKVSWKGGKWQNPQAKFEKMGNAWQAQNIVTVPAGTRMGSFLPLEVEATVGDTGDEDVRLSWSRKFNVVASVASLELTLAAKGRSASRDGIDLFFPNYLPDGNRFAAVPIYRDDKGNELAPETIKRFLDVPSLRLKSDTPAVALVDGNGGQVGRAAGEAWIEAELGGMDLDPRGEFETAKGAMLVSNPVKVTANQLLLSRGKPSGGFTPYALRVIGPAKMNQYQALFHFDGGSTGTPFTQGPDGSYLAGISSVVPVKKVEILSGGKTIAMLPVRDDTVIPQAGIKLMPVTVPDRVIDRITLVDTGSLMSSTECRKQMRTQYPGYYGNLSDDALNEVCDTIRDAEKKEIKEQRAIQKDQQKIVKLLKKEGRQLVVFEDSAQLGAVVTGNFDTDRMFCRWRVDQGGSLKFDRPQSPITKVGADGSCFNDLKGFQGNFDTEATVTVELIYAHPAAAQGQFMPGGTQVMRADVDAKQVEEWVNN
jgi:hypothetical protein